MKNKSFRIIAERVFISLFLIWYISFIYNGYTNARFPQEAYAFTWMILTNWHTAICFTYLLLFSSKKDKVIQCLCWLDIILEVLFIVHILNNPLVGDGGALIGYAIAFVSFGIILPIALIVILIISKLILYFVKYQEKKEA